MSLLPRSTGSLVILCKRARTKPVTFCCSSPRGYDLTHSASVCNSSAIHAWHLSRSVLR